MEFDLMNYEVEDHDEANEAFAITNDSLASWALRKLKAMSDRCKEVQAIAEVEYQRIDAWERCETGKTKDKAIGLEMLLFAYAKEQRALGRKTITLPYGSVASRTTQDKLDFGPTFEEWASLNATYLLTKKVSYLPNREEVKKAIAEGFPVSGVTVVPGGVNFSIKFAE